MKTKTAIVREVPGLWEVHELELDAPKEHEVLVRMVGSGLCHSCAHIAQGDVSVPHLPLAGGHEGAGVIEEVGPGVRGLSVGDHIVTSFIPTCGRCRFCASGQGNLCDNGAVIMEGKQLDGTYRMHLGDEDVAQEILLSTFSEYTVLSEWSCIKIDKDVPLQVASLLGCGVPTGWGSATNGAKVAPGDVVVVYGVGGVGINAVQGASHSGAGRVIAVDPVAFKRETALKLGATDAVATHEEALDLAQSVTNGQGADSAIVTIGTVTGQHIASAASATRKGGTVVVTGASHETEANIPMSVLELVMYQRRIQGTLFGMMSPAKDVPILLGLWQQGHLKLEEIATTTYALDDINKGYEDMHAGVNMRGVIGFG